MAKGVYIGVNSVARKIKKGYIGVNGVARKIKKVYIGVGGIARLCWVAGANVADMRITSSGAMIDHGIVTMGNGNKYRLLEVTKSGTLTFSEQVTGEVWMCGGGTSGQYGAGAGGGGGAGAFTTQGNVTLSGSMVATIGAGGSKSYSEGAYYFGGATSFAGLTTPTNFKWYSTWRGIDGGSGGGTNGTYEQNPGGSGDGKDKHPFLDAVYFTKIPCAGGGGGPSVDQHWNETNEGGNGGSNGGNGTRGNYDTNSSSDQDGGSGGNTGGGAGGRAWTEYGEEEDYYYASDGENATYYGSGGGGGARIESNDNDMGNGGAGYQGVIFIRIPVNQ